MLGRITSRLRWIALVAVLIAINGCNSARRTDAPSAPLDPTRMSHERHAQIPCISCHRATQTADLATVRPGSDDHKPCDDGACHRKEFVGAPGLFCQVCHLPVTTNPLSAPLKPYPSDDAWQSLPPQFSHRKHLDAGKMEASVGFHVACADCHSFVENKLAPPDHATCARCHAAEARLQNAPRMDACGQCHQPGIQERQQRRLIKGDLKFEHQRHITDRRGNTIRCEECHAQSAQAMDAARHAPPRVEACVACHDDGDRTPGVSRMRACETCHTARSNTLTSIAPRNHLPLTERPLDHTIAFRRDHAEAAERSAARCAACHTQMSGNARQACDECHQTTKPADHRVTYRELDHGADAVADRDRCATCHVVEFCTACHKQRPRSHGFSFTTSHREPARVDVRACLTCHLESSCDQCHRAAPMGTFR